MGLDIALGVLILIAAIRGWIQGFVYQVVRLAGLVACVYLADPVRENAKPYVLPYLPTIQPEFVDRLLWWVSAAVSYVVLVGLTTLVIKMTRRPEIPGLAQTGRHDQFAGFLVGVAKGVLIAAFLTAGIQKYALKQITTIAWAGEQVKSSWALRWNDVYQPAAKVWSSVPVQHFVNHIQHMGLQQPAEATVADPDPKTGERPLAQTASRNGDRAVARPSQPSDEPSRPAHGAPVPPAPKTGVGDTEVEKAVAEIRATIDAVAKPSN